ncbi:PP2C-domain-containing protein [Panus rudis PR-1116 ss-1]|nr:PP2C-domain-containing protein [Panus rudis PR-1116 ss-1]
MGQTLSIPDTEKYTDHGSNAKFAYAVTEMQGWRITMEDAHTVDLNLDQKQDKSNTFFAVYDGHGGGATAKYAGQHVHKRLVSEDPYKKGEYNEALKQAFLGIDQDMREDPAFTRDTSGCTAVAALVTDDDRIFVANAGDSRSVISVKGEAKQLSYDHKPAKESERSRIIAAGGYVEFGRVNGNLALARALGDFEYKKNKSIPPEAQIITSNPDIIEHKITEEDEFFVLACDGIWDCLSSQQVVDIVRLLVSQGKKLTEVCEQICDLCLAPDTNVGSGFGCDNMTILIVAILHGRTEDEWYQWITDRVNNDVGRKIPKELPHLYPAQRLEMLRRRLQSHHARRDAERKAAEGEGSADGGLLASAAGSGSSSGLSLLDNDNDSDDSDSGSAMHSGPDYGLSFLVNSGGMLGPTEFLRQQLGSFAADDDSDDELDSDEDGEGEEDSSSHPKPDGEASHRELQGEAPPPPPSQAPAPNGDASVPQLKSDPGGDAPSPAVKAEGLMDTSEDPFKV